MLKEEIIEALQIFDEYNLSEDRQRRIFNSGVYFDFTYGDHDYNNRNRRLGVIEFATLLKTCKFYGIDIDANKIVDYPWDTAYENMLKLVSNMKCKNEIINVKKIGSKE